VKKKQANPAQAADLYTSSLWRHRRAYAEASGSPWFILSAKYGLLEPSEFIDPYDLALKSLGSRERRVWGEEVVIALRERLGSLRSVVFEIHAGAFYRDAVRPSLESEGAVLVNPVVAGREGAERPLPQGKLAGWYRQQSKQPTILTSPPPTPERAVAALSDGEAVPASQASTMLNSVEAPGLYSWWVDDAGANALSNDLGSPVAPGLIYLGQAGATKWPSGKRSGATIASRVLGNHIGGSVRGSTFRLTLAASLLAALDLRVAAPCKLAPESERKLTDWIMERLSVRVFPSDDPDGLLRLEDLVLGLLDPLLNLEGRPPSRLRTSLGMRRAQITGSGRSSSVSGGQN
jgi:hypothetical protein